MGTIKYLPLCGGLGESKPLWSSWGETQGASGERKVTQKDGDSPAPLHLPPSPCPGTSGCTTSTKQVTSTHHPGQTHLQGAEVTLHEIQPQQPTPSTTDHDMGIPNSQRRDPPGLTTGYIWVLWSCTPAPACQGGDLWSG